MSAHSLRYSLKELSLCILSTKAVAVKLEMVDGFWSAATVFAGVVSAFAFLGVAFFLEALAFAVTTPVTENEKIKKKYA